MSDVRLESRSEDEPHFGDPTEELDDGMEEEEDDVEEDEEEEDE